MKHVIIVPTYNERKNIQELIPRIFAAVPEASVLVVDDNSPDGTAQEVVNLQKQFPNIELLIREKKQGLGKAYIQGFSHALQDPSVLTVTMMDADLSHDPAYLPEMLRQSERYNVVTGSRYIQGGSVSGWEFWRRILSHGGNAYCRLITRLPLHDCTGGFNVIQAGKLRTIDLNQITMFGYAFIFELKYLLYAQGASFTEVPICFKNRTEGESKMSKTIITEGIIGPWKLLLNKLRA